MLKSIEKLNSSVSGDTIFEHPEYKNASRRLYECWSTNVDIFIRNAVAFAKKLPGFQQIPIADQIKLIKYGRSEIAFIVKYKHFHPLLSACIDYHVDTKAMDVFPNRIMHSLIIGRDNPNAERHHWAFKRSVSITIFTFVCSVTLFQDFRFWPGTVSIA